MWYQEKVVRSKRDQCVIDHITQRVLTGSNEYMPHGLETVLYFFLTCTHSAEVMERPKTLATNTSSVVSG